MKLRLGIIGMSPGNGHPYSWSAIFNGYDHESMINCGFPTIPEYLSKQQFPEDGINTAEVTHVWTQNFELSKHISKASRIPNIVNELEQMIGEVDAILLARDDAENHLKFAAPFLNAGIPIYIDKPLALSTGEAKRMLSMQKFPGQLFSCSALRYASELTLDRSDLNKIGKIQFIDAVAPKDWEKYSIHVIDPIIKIIGENRKIESVSIQKSIDCKTVILTYDDNLTVRIATLGKTPTPISIRVHGQHAWKDMLFKNTFNAFKCALSDFIQGAINRDIRITENAMLTSIEAVEAGLSS